MAKVKLLGNYLTHGTGDVITVGAGEIAYLKGMGLYSKHVDEEPIKEEKPATKADKPSKPNVRSSK